MYRTAFHREVAEETPLGSGYWTWGCDINLVKQDVEDYLKWITERLEASDARLCLSDTTNFRKDISDTYKGNRSWMKRPVVLRPLREWLISEKGAIVYPTLEGDDVMGILATQDDTDTIIVSLDKDMKTIPGRFYRSEADGVINISTEEADYYHLYQTLIGDVSDGYKGCPGIGAAKAKKLLDDTPTWDAVVSTFEKAGLTEEDALQQARLARILRSSDYPDGQVKLWSPQ
jgi:DNA polymerase-1